MKQISWAMLAAITTIACVSLCQGQVKAYDDEPDACLLPKPTVNELPADAAAPTGDHSQTVRVDRPLPKCAAEASLLDTTKPLLSKDGKGQAKTDTRPELASSECLIEATANGSLAQCMNRKRAPEAKQIKATPAARQTELTETPTKLDYVVFNLVRWYKRSDKPIYQSDWYLYDRRKGRYPSESLKPLTPNVSGDLRIKGSDNVAFVAIHLGIDDTCDIEYSIKAKHKTAQNVADFQQWVSTVASLAPGNFGKIVSNFVVAQATSTGNNNYIGILAPKIPPKLPHAAGVGVFGLAYLTGMESLPYDLTFSGKPQLQTRVVSDADKNRVSQPFAFKEAQNPQLAARDSGDAQQAVVTWDNEQVPVTCAAAPKKTIVKSTSSFIPATWIHANGIDQAPADQNSGTGDQNNGGSNGATAKQTTADTPSFEQTYSNEGLHHWDVSLGLPVKTAKETTFSVGQDNTVSRTTKLPEDLYGFGDFFPIKTDLIKPPAIRWPSITGGLPIASRPFNRIVAGSSLGFSIAGIRVAPFVGVLFLREFRPQTFGEGSTTTATKLKADLRPEHHYRLFISVNVSGRDIAKLVKSAATSGSSSSGQSASGSSSGNKKSAGSKNTGP